MTGAEMIAAERRRQITEEGWTPEHDDGHGGGELAMAAACYAASEPIYHLDDSEGDGDFRFSDPWPWRPEDDKREWSPIANGLPPAWRRKRSDNRRIRELVKAGALIAAEIDRLQRTAMVQMTTRRVIHKSGRWGFTVCRQLLQPGTSTRDDSKVSCGECLRRMELGGWGE